MGRRKFHTRNRRMLECNAEVAGGQHRFVEPDVGGSFGVRGEFYPEDFLIPWLAIRLRKPVRWIEDRFEHFSAINHSRQSELEVRAAADAKEILRLLSCASRRTWAPTCALMATLYPRISLPGSLALTE